MQFRTLCCLVVSYAILNTFIVHSSSVEIASSDKTAFNSLLLTQSQEVVDKLGIDALLSTSTKDNLVVFYSSPSDGVFSASAIAQTKERYLVNSFLTGFSPFSSNNIWLIQAALNKFTYLADRDGPSAEFDQWKTGTELFKTKIGDCEDHAIAFADILISHDIDAKVVMGTYHNRGHVWVMLTAGPQDYLIEATNKFSSNRPRLFPVAKHMTNYRPLYMFNRTEFWSYENPQKKLVYDRSLWKHKSKASS
jgi:hypothetical protein